MAVNQLPGQVREFAGYLNKLMTRLDQGGGWCAVFWQRDPEGMRACLDGLEVPPWDVVEALMHDLGSAYGPAAAAQETERARALHRASLAAYDSRPGGRDALGDRFDVMLREQRYAADRAADLTRRLQAATSQEEADSLRLDLAWAHDDHERATARCTELRTRIEDADRRAPHRPVRGAARVAGSAVGDVRRVPEQGERADDPTVHPVGRTRADEFGDGRTYPDRSGGGGPHADRFGGEQRARGAAYDAGRPRPDRYGGGGTDGWTHEGRSPDGRVPDERASDGGAPRGHASDDRRHASAPTPTATSTPTPTLTLT
ncbi:hypothetical protein P1P70_22250, partial [Streptomyces sp. MB09-02B]|nr:hypothetical protein [Streptomyces sp. MB09-02B]